MWEETERKQRRFLMHPGWRRLSEAGEAVLDFLFPPACPGCGCATGSHLSLCGPCWVTVAHIEEPLCAVLGLPFASDRGRGAVSPEAIANPPAFDCLRAVAVHDGVVRHLVHGLKYHHRTELAPMMALWMARAGRAQLEAADAVLPVPLHRWRLLSRHYNQAAELSRAVARLTGLPHLPASLLRRRPTSRQVGLGRKARQRNMEGAFVVPDDRCGTVAGRRLVLVDDVYTTGATANAAARALRRAGAAHVAVLTFAMADAEPI